MCKRISLFVVACLLGCGGGENGSSNGNASGDLSYPKLYVDAGLPQYPNAKLTDTGRQTSSLDDGLRLTLESQDDVQTIAAVFERELKAAGWTVPEPKIHIETIHMVRATKANQVYQALITHSRRYEDCDQLQSQRARRLRL